MTDIYLDHAATTPMTQEALAAYADAARRGANASSQHARGRVARRIVEESRERIAAIVGARPSEVIFTAGGTEADNLAVKGAFFAQPRRDVVVVGEAEHHAVLDSARWLATYAGAQVRYVPVSGDGGTDAGDLARVLDEADGRVAIASLMWVNNEVGTISPIAEIAAECRARAVASHSDAVQALGLCPIDFGKTQLGAMTIAAHKVGGPIGVGALVATRDFPLVEIMSGGGQERAVRSGTLDAPAIAGFAAALEQAAAGRESQVTRQRQIRDYLIDRVLAEIPHAHLRGVDPRVDATRRLSGNALFTFDGCEGDSLLFALDSSGVSASTGSACQAGVPQPSHVLMAMGLSEDEARGALRFSLGCASTKDDIDGLLAVLPGAIERARRAGQVGRMKKETVA